MPDETVLVAPAETNAGSSPAEVEAPITDSTEVEQPVETLAEGDEAAPVEAETEETQADETEADPEDKSLSEWKGSAAARLRELCKMAPGLEKALNANPKLRDSIAAAFKRDAALRDRNVTIAEIDEYRSRCVNGLQDLEAMERSLAETNELDNAFFSRDREGNYPGHADFVRNLVEQDRDATLAVLKRIPKDFAQNFPEEYNETFGAIMASTFAKDGILDRVADMHALAKEAGDAQAVRGLASLWHYLDSFGKKKQSNDPEAERLRTQLSERDRRDAERSQQDNKRYHDSLLSDTVRNHRSIVSGHDLIKKLPQAISKEKRGRIVDEVCRRIESHLGKSYSFKRDIEQAYLGRDSKAYHEVDRKGWQPWLVNLYVRKVLNEETPGIIQGNKTANAAKRTAAAKNGIANRAPTQALPKPGAQRERTKPSDYTMEEIMAGKVPEHVMDAYIASRGR